MSVAVCPGSFDPVTWGHVDIFRRAAALFDRVYVVVVVNSLKTPLFSSEERAAMIREAVEEIPGIEVEVWDGLLADYAAQKGACALVRGVRGPQDLAYEQMLFQVNRHLTPGLESVLLCAEPSLAYVSSTVVRDMIRYHRDTSFLVPPGVYKRIAERENKEKECPV